MTRGPHDKGNATGQCSGGSVVRVTRGNGATRQRQQDEARVARGDVAMWRRRQDEARAMCGEGEGDTWQRGGQRMAKATRDGGAGDQREGNGQHLKKKEKRQDTPGVCSVLPRVYERGAAS
jgi:hypothetical protein